MLNINLESLNYFTSRKINDEEYYVSINKLPEMFGVITNNITLDDSIQNYIRHILNKLNTWAFNKDKESLVGLYKKITGCDLDVSKRSSYQILSYLITYINDHIEKYLNTHKIRQIEAFKEEYVKLCERYKLEIIPEKENANAEPIYYVTTITNSTINNIKKAKSYA